MQYLDGRICKGRKLRGIKLLLLLLLLVRLLSLTVVGVLLERIPQTGLRARSVSSRYEQLLLLWLLLLLLLIHDVGIDWTKRRHERRGV